jgi:hypothetical protein
MRRFALLLAATLATIASARADDQQPAPGFSSTGWSAITVGDIAISGFPGVKLSGNSVAPGVDPLDQTVIDEDGKSLRVLELKNIGGSLTGQPINPLIKFEIRARDIGLVFSIALESDPQDTSKVPNLYVAATSAFGLHIVGSAPGGEGQVARLKAGAPNARYMAGQFGSLPEGGPGSIWKIDGQTGAVSLFANTIDAGIANSGAGIGGLAYDPASRTLYASDLETGLIHRLSIGQNGADLGQFDHGKTGRKLLNLPVVTDDGRRAEITDPQFRVDDPATWGLTQAERRIDAMAVHNGRLYYAVAAGPEIFSIGINADGNFVSDVKSELLVKSDRPAPVTGMIIDSKGRMTLAIRGAVKPSYDFSRFTEPGAGQVLRYLPEVPDNPATPDAWVPQPQEYAIGFSDSQKGAAGGVSQAHAYRSDGTVDLTSCEGTLVSTGNALASGPPLHGAQLNAIDAVLPKNVPPSETAFIDFDGKPDEASGRGLVGDIEAVRNCSGTSGQGYPPVAAEPGLPPVVSGGAGPGGFPPVVGEAPGAQKMPPVVDASSPPAEAQPLPPVVDEPPGQGGGGKGEPKTGEATNAEGIKVTKTGPASCAPDQTCAFDIKLENTTDKDIPGEVVVNDALTTAAGPMAGATLVADPDAPWKCTGGGASLDCRHPGPLLAKASLPALKLTFKLSPVAGAKELSNCAFVSGKAPDKPGPATPAPDKQGQLPPVDGVLTKPDAAKAPDAVTDREPPIIYGGAAPPPAAPPASKPWSLGGDKKFCNAEFCVVVEDIGNPEFVHFRVEAFPGRVDDIYNLIAGAEPQVEIKNGALTYTRRGTDVSIQGCAQSAVTSFCGMWHVFPLGRLLSCRDFANTALEQVAEAFSNRCNFGTPRWTNRGDHHFYWCMNLADNDHPAQSNSETLGRSQDLLSCKESFNYCAAYAKAAEADIKTQQERKCNFSGPRWSLASDHLGWCMQQRPDKAPIEADAAERARQLEGCVGGVVAKIPGDVAADPKKPLKTVDPGQPLPAPAQPPAPQACVTIPLEAPQTGDIRITKASTLTPGSAPGRCRCAIKLENGSDKPASGPFVIEDDITVDGAFIGATKIDLVENGIGSDWKCEKTGQTFSCTQSVPIPPKKEALVEITFSIGSGIGVPKEIKNCATLKGTANKACVTIPQQPPGQPGAPADGPIVREAPKLPGDFVAAPNLKLTKTGPTTCPLAGPCDFKMTVKNEGAVDYKGKLTINDTISPSRVASFEVVSAGLPVDCTPGKGEPTSLVRCTFFGVDGLKVGEQKSFNAKLFPAGEWKKADVLRNCAQISHDLASNDPVKTHEDVCVDVKLDPFALTISKSGDQTCKPGSECHFKLEVFNPGPILHDAPVTFIDGIKGLSPAQIVSITPPLPCPAQPTQIPFSCTVAKMRLEIGQRETYDMVVRLPGDASAAAFTNCAILSAGNAAPAGNAANLTSNAAVANAGSQTEGCHTVALGDTTAAPQCAGGMVAGTDGRCECPPGTAWTGRTCATGTAGSGRAKDASAEPSLQCAGGMVAVSDGRCACPARSTWNGRTCVDDDTASGGASTSQDPSPAPAQPREKRRRPPPPEPESAPTKSKGSGGSDRSKSVPADDVPDCRNGMILKKGICACPPGEEFRRGRCRAERVEPPKCPKGTYGTPPACCPPGTNYKNGVCVRPAPKPVPKPQSVECPEGSIKIGGICLKLPKKKDKPVPAPEPKREPPLPPQQQPDGGLPPLKKKIPGGIFEDKGPVVN